KYTFAIHGSFDLNPVAIPLQDLADGDFVATFQCKQIELILVDIRYRSLVSAYSGDRDAVLESQIGKSPGIAQKIFEGIFGADLKSHRTFHFPFYLDSGLERRD